MGAVLTVNETTTQMVRLVGDKLVQEESQRNIYIVPPAGRHRFMVTGYALPFEMKRAEKFMKPGDSPTQTMTRLELTISEGKGKGRMFTLLLGYSIGPKSNLGKFLRGLDVDLTPNEHGEWDLDNAIGYTGECDFKPTESLDEQGKPKGTVANYDFVTPIAAPDRKYSITITEQAPAAASNGHTAATSDDGWE